MAKRPPIIVIMGSVDHGKTTLLDYIRKTNVAAKEAGGITQSIGAYEIMHQSQTYAERTQTNAEKSQRMSASGLRESASSERRRITFIDTPGHEAFSKMKTRGAKIADLAILVVAADDGVQPQTKEAIKIIKESETTFVVAINKIDRVPDATKVKNELMQAGVLLEGYGGDVSYQPISAKTGEGVNELLDLVLLAAELEHLDYDPSHHASGYVLEAKLDSRRGVLATLIITDGTLKAGEEIAAGEAYGKVKILENFLGKRTDSLTASAPAVVAGFESLPKAGEKFHVGKPEEIKTLVATAKQKKAPLTDLEKTGVVNLILKADVSGSLEALSQIIKNLPKKEGREIEIIGESVGEITDGDVKLAISTKSLIIGFRTSATKAAENLARAHNIKIVQSEIIYDLVKVAEEALELLGKKIAKGRLEILATFSKKGTKQVIGGKVTDGNIVNNAALEIERRNEIIGEGKILNLQQAKKDVKTVPAGNECGMLFDSQVEIKVGDVLLMR